MLNSIYCKIANSTIGRGNCHLTCLSCSIKVYLKYSKTFKPFAFAYTCISFLNRLPFPKFGCSTFLFFFSKCCLARICTVIYEPHQENTGFRISENNGAAPQCHSFCYTACSSNCIQNFKLLVCFCDCTGRLVSGLIQSQFPCIAAHMVMDFQCLTFSVWLRA